MLRDEARSLIQRSPLAARADRIEALLEPLVAIDTQRISDDVALPVGTSKVGGAPDLPPETPWPEAQGGPLAFLMQICLEEVAESTPETARALPPTGLLSFFYGPNQLQGVMRVLYSDQPEHMSHLQRLTPPATLEAKKRYHPCSVRFSAGLMLPLEGGELHGLDFSREKTILESDGRLISQDDVYGDLAGQINSLARSRTHLLGYPLLIQGNDLPMYEFLREHGLDVYTATFEQQMEASVLGAQEWQLLAQIEGDAQAGMRWGDAGALYCYIKRADLAMRNFGHISDLIEYC